MRRATVTLLHGVCVEFVSAESKVSCEERASKVEVGDKITTWPIGLACFDTPPFSLSALECPLEL